MFSSCQGSKQQLKLFSPRKPAGLHRIVMFVSLFEIPNHYFQLHRTQNWCRNSPYTSHTWQFPPYLLCSSLPQSHKTSNRTTWTTAWWYLTPGPAARPQHGTDPGTQHQDCGTQQGQIAPQTNSSVRQRPSCCPAFIVHTVPNAIWCCTKSPWCSVPHPRRVQSLRSAAGDG